MPNDPLPPKVPPRTKKKLGPEAERALAEAAERQAQHQAERDAKSAGRPKEVNGRDGPEPTRFGDWEKDGLISDF